MSKRDTDKLVIPVPVDEVTAGRLETFARACGMEPLAAASRLLSDLLADDELYNAAAEEAPLSH